MVPWTRTRVITPFAVTTRVTVPTCAPLLNNGIPTLTPVSVDVAPPARTLCEFACAIPVAEACSGPWLFSRRWLFVAMVVVVAVEALARTLCEFACAIPVADACNGPWLFSRRWLFIAVDVVVVAAEPPARTLCEFA